MNKRACPSEKFGLPTWRSKGSEAKDEERERTTTLEDIYSEDWSEPENAYYGVVSKGREEEAQELHAVGDWRRQGGGYGNYDSYGYGTENASSQVAHLGAGHVDDGRFQHGVRQRLGGARAHRPHVRLGLLAGR